MKLYSLSFLKNWRSLQVFERKSSSSLMIVRCFYCGEQSTGRLYLGIRASKKVGGAVLRNFLRRRMRNIAQEIFLNQKLHLNCVYLISILPPASNANFLSLREDFTGACESLYQKIDSSHRRLSSNRKNLLESA